MSIIKKNAMKTILTTLVLAILIAPFQAQYEKYQDIMSEEQYNNLEDGLYASMKTNKGTMLFELYEDEAPMTVANFVGLAEGVKQNEAHPLGTPFYNGTIFHRIIKNFMVQGGDPTGTGMGGPGYKFADEKNTLNHDSKGYLSMANSGPNTNGSQFFITEIATPWLDGRHTIFGKLKDGESVFDTIASVETAAQDKPVDDVILEEVNIIRKGKEYKEYNGAEAFTVAQKNLEERNKMAAAKAKEKMEALKKENLKLIEQWSDNLQTTSSGLQYRILKSSNGVAPKKGDKLEVHYRGMLEDGTQFDSSFEREIPISFEADLGKMIRGWDEGIMLLKEGERAVFFIPSDLGYGSNGAGGVIPPNANLVFELELLKVN